MPINLHHDELLTLGEACRLLPRKPSPATLWRWRTKGILIGKQRIKLECVRVGGQWCTTADAMAEFLQRQTKAALEVESNQPSTRSDSTVRRLQESGLM